MLDEEAIRRIVKEAVHETLSGLGLDVHELKEMQADMVYLRHARKGREQMVAKANMTFLTMVLTAVLYLLWDAFKNKLKGG